MRLYDQWTKARRRLFHQSHPFWRAILAAAVLLGGGTVGPLFTVAAATLLLICVGIHNAWDTVTYLTFAALRREVPAETASTPPRRNDSKPHGRRKR